MHLFPKKTLTTKILEHLAKHPKNKLFKNTDQSLSSNTSEYEASSTRSKSHTSTCIWDPANIESYMGKNRKINNH